MAQEDVSRRVVGQVLGDLVERFIDDLILILLNLVGLLVYVVCNYNISRGAVATVTAAIAPFSRGVNAERERKREREETYIQMTACGPLAREVPSRNLRR